MDYFKSSLNAALEMLIHGDGQVYFIVWTSLKISLAAVGLASVLAVPCGVAFGMAEFPGKRLLRQLLGTLMALPTVVVGLLLYGLLSRRGPLGDWGILYTPTAVIIGECVLIMPLMIHLVSTAAMENDPRLFLTLKSLGANTWQYFVRVVSETRAGIIGALVAGFGRAVGEVGIAMMLGGNIQGLTRTMTTAIALETSKGEFELGLALGILLLAVAFTVNGLLAWLQSVK
ncbi:MAG TPA: ABC transporter permease subunit [Gammaproteobacteria bacterium]|nr:ABC transporter permease subunit [Gammaproteobacteria bacterium]